MTDDRQSTTDANTLPMPGSADLPVGNAIPVRGALPFAARFQTFLIVLMFVGFVGIAQQRREGLYQIGLIILVIAAFLQIAFGNIPPSANFTKSMKLLALTWAIVAAVFGLGILLAPRLVELGR